MASRTQIRLQQLTGSLVDLKTEAQQYVAPATAAALTGSDLQDVLGAFGAALNRIHGATSDEPFNNTAGLFRSETNAAGALTLKADAGSSQTILLVNDEGTASNAIDLVATAGGFSVDGVQASNITVTSAGAADDLTISQVGGNDSSILITAAGTGADAVSIDATAGSMVIAPSLINGKTLKLGNNASTEMIFTPAADAADEKISLVNKAGTADTAILIDAEAGGVTIAAGNDSLVLDADGTDADAIIINSAGGIDVDAVDKINIATTKASADALVIDVSGNGGADITIGNAANDANANLDLIVMNKFNIDAQGTDSGDGVQITLGSDTTDTVFKVVNNSGADAFSINGGKNANIAGNLTVAGNLDINGTTTTIDTANLSIQDSIIALGVSGSDGGYSASGDRGILFTRGTDSSFNNGLFWDGTDFKFAVTNTGPNSGSFAAPANAAAYSTVRVGKLNSENTTDATSTTDGALQTDGGLSVALDAVIGNDLHLLSNAAVLNLGSAQKFTLTHANANNTALVAEDHRLAFGDAGDYITGDGDDLTIVGSANVIIDAETDIVLDAKGNDIFLKDNGQIFTTFTNGNNSALVLSGGFAGGNIHLDSNGGVIALQKGGTNMNAIELESTGMKIGLFDGASGNFNAGFLHLKDSGGNASILSGTVGLRLDVGQEAAALQLMTNNADRFIALQAPDGVSTNVTFKLPAEDGSANQVLITDGSAALSFATAASAADARKGIFEIASTLSAGSALATNSGEDFGSDAITFGGVTGIQGRVVDVFVNGQLLTSGSATARGNAEVDFEIASTTSLKFAFDLEPDDIVQVVKRG